MNLDPGPVPESSHWRLNNSLVRLSKSAHTHTHIYKHTNTHKENISNRVKECLGTDSSRWLVILANGVRMNRDIDGLRNGERFRNLERCRDGRMTGQRNGGMEEWRNGGMEEW